MKRMIKANSNPVIFEDENFQFIKTHGIGRNNTPWKGLDVITKKGSLAKKHVVEVRLNTKGWVDMDGTPVEYEYKDCYIAHGMRSSVDTLDDTREYIDVLEDAIDFAERVDEYLYRNYSINDYE